MSHHPERTARNVRPVNQPPSFFLLDDGGEMTDERLARRVAHLFFACQRAEDFGSQAGGDAAAAFDGGGGARAEGAAVGFGADKAQESLGEGFTVGRLH